MEKQISIPMGLASLLAQWVEKRGPDIEKAIITLQENSYSFVIVQSKVKYDEKLQDDVADLEFEVSQKFNLIRLRTILLPPILNESLASFVDKEQPLIILKGKI